MTDRQRRLSLLKAQTLPRPFLALARARRKSVEPGIRCHEGGQIRSGNLMREALQFHLYRVREL